MGCLPDIFNRCSPHGPPIQYQTPIPPTKEHLKRTGPELFLFKLNFFNQLHLPNLVNPESVLFGLIPIYPGVNRRRAYLLFLRKICYCDHDGTNVRNKYKTAKHLSIKYFQILCIECCADQILCIHLFNNQQHENKRTYPHPGTRPRNSVIRRLRTTPCDHRLHCRLLNRDGGLHPRAIRILTPYNMETATNRYEQELARFEKLMQANKPHPETFATPEAYTKAYNEWQMAWSCDRPNKPGYYRANND